MIWLLATQRLLGMQGGGMEGGGYGGGEGGGGAGDFFKIKRKNQNGTCFFSPKLSVGIPIK